MEKIINITSPEQYDEILANNSNVITDFYAEWCGPCRQLAPVLDIVSSKREDLVICKVNVDTNPELTVRYSVTGIPAIFFVKNGESVHNLKGFTPTKQFEGLIQTHLGI